MDFVDQSDIETENYILDTIKKNSSSGIKNGGLIPDGMCHHCENDVPHPKLFCNGECATKYDIAQRRMRN